MGQGLWRFRGSRVQDWCVSIVGSVTSWPAVLAWESEGVSCTESRAVGGDSGAGAWMEEGLTH